MQEFSTGKFHGDPTSLRTPAAIATGVQSNIALSSSFCPPQAQPLPLNFRDWRHVPLTAQNNVTVIAQHWIVM
jgi:hypothetical protein